MNKCVYFSHDGGVDDLVSLFLLLQMNVDLLGVSVVDADSYVAPATEASRKIVDRFGHGKNLAISVSTARGVHPFPKEWRLTTFQQNALPILNESGTIRTPITTQPAQLDLLQHLQATVEPVTLLFTGPLTDLARVLEMEPQISAKIEKLIWMGGTFLENGNVAEPDSDGTQEWNAFWDPAAVATVFASPIKIDLVSLESTNNVPLTAAIRQHWATYRRFSGFDFLGNSYALVPELRQFATNSTYYLWDVLTTCYFYQPDLVKTKKVLCKVNTTAPSDGRLYQDATGREVTLAYDVNSTKFFKLLDYLAAKAE
ncbi:MAG: nucleoside hydrolase [Liquorilactobacillus ghanensis]|uniref:nucleoside hydrolase n=1 Tax=Liquorilactobacillus ghanensis TaxID=399370 RepID=UPI0039EAB130